MIPTAASIPNTAMLPVPPPCGRARAGRCRLVDDTGLGLAFGSSIFSISASSAAGSFGRLAGSLAIMVRTREEVFIETSELWRRTSGSGALMCWSMTLPGESPR